MSWNSNNRAHACLWLFEIWDKNKREAGFDEVGNWKSDFIIKSAVGDSSEMRQKKARTHAKKLDGAFISLYRAKYEPGQDGNSAINAMGAVLSNNASTMSDLADVVDAKYRFLGEV